MAGYSQQNPEYWTNPNQNYNFEVPDQFGQELNFQAFEANQENVNVQQGGYGIVPNQQSYGGGTFLDPSMSYGQDMYAQPQPVDYGASGISNEFEDEPPLLEELGINPQQILQKTLSVLNPMRTTESSILQDTDLAGPLVFVLALGGFLLLRGKVTFSYIYGIGVLGCLAFWCLLTLMATQAKVTIGAVVSVLGYCILPMVVLSGLNVIISMQGLLGTILAGVCILWCAISASKLFVTAYAMDHQQILIAYPCALLYGVFALITIF